MLESLLLELCKKMKIEPFVKTKENVFILNISPEMQVFLKDLNPGISFRGIIFPLVKENQESLFIYLMKANLLHQGTGGAAIGVDPEEKFLTLTLSLPYEVNYQSFKESLEDFTNYLVYWKKELANFEKKAKNQIY